MPDSAWLWLLAPLASLVTSYGVVAAARPWLHGAGVLDRPSQRSSHQAPTPRGGGIGMVAGFAVGLALIVASWAAPGLADAGHSQVLALAGLAAGACTVAMVGFVDDLRPLPIGPRLLAQALAAVLVAASVGVVDALRVPFLGEMQLGLLAPPITVLWVLAVTNFYNFMDGIDGLAAGQAAIAGACLALAGVLTGHHAVALASACLAAAALGFLPHNVSPARVFMGDVGSTFLGFLFAALAVLGAQPGATRISLYVSILLLAPFLFDATLTLALRVWRGERWYEPHRSHLYQRLVRAGYSHRQVSLLYYLLALLLGVLGLVEVATGQGATEVFLLFGLAPLAVMALWVRRVEAAARAVQARTTQS